MPPPPGKPVTFYECHPDDQSVTFFVPDVLREELVQPHRLSIGPGGVLLSGAWIMPEVTLKSLNQVQHWKRRFAY